MKTERKAFQKVHLFNFPHVRVWTLVRVPRCSRAVQAQRPGAMGGGH